jgi:hypothetical protein
MEVKECVISPEFLSNLIGIDEHTIPRILVDYGFEYTGGRIAPKITGKVTMWVDHEANTHHYKQEV